MLFSSLQTIKICDKSGSRSSNWEIGFCLEFLLLHTVQTMVWKMRECQKAIYHSVPSEYLHKTQSVLYWKIEWKYTYPTNMILLGKASIKKHLKLWNFPSKFIPPTPHLWRKKIKYHSIQREL